MNGYAWACRAAPAARGCLHAAKRTRSYEVLVTLKDGWYVADVPALPGCIAQGRSEREALTNVRDAIDGYLDVLREQGREVPRPKVVRVAIGE